MSPPNTGRAMRSALAVTLTLLFIQLASAVWLLVHHAWAVIHFPYSLDYGEGPLLNQAVRLSRLENIYRTDLSAPPFVISNYPPLFPLVQAPFAAVFGPGFWYGRLISTLSITAATLFIGLTLHRLTGDLVASVVGGLLLPSFAFVLHWSAFNRVDCLALALCCAALFSISCQPRGRAGLSVTALLLTAAIFTRQSYALAAPLAAFVWLLREPSRRRQAFELAVMVAGSSVALLTALQFASHGGFFFHIDTANVNPFSWSYLLDRAGEMVVQAPLLLVIAGLFAVVGARHQVLSWWLVAPFLLGATASASTVGKAGSNVNYFFELCAALSLASGALLAWTRNTPGRCAVLSLVLALQVGLMVKSSRDDYTQWVRERMAQHDDLECLLKVVREADGPVLADEVMGLLPLTGKRLYAQPFELKQLVEFRVWDEQPFVQMIEQQEFAAILIHDPPEWNAFEGRWTERQRLSIHRGYASTERIADTIVYRPNRSKEPERVDVEEKACDLIEANPQVPVDGPTPP